MTSYLTVSGVSQLLDTNLWDSEKLDEEVITLAPTVSAWINEQVGKTVDYTPTELAAEPIIVLAANSFAVYTLLSTQLDGHHVDEISLAMRRLDDAKDYIRAYCFRNGITPAFDAVEETVSGVVDFAMSFGADGECI